MTTIRQESFFQDENFQIAASALGIALAFWLAWPHRSLWEILPTVGLGFVLHELGHRWMARRYGAHARYVMWPEGIAASMVLAFALGIVFAAPGAVCIAGKLDREKNGKVALAGPAVNLILSSAFIALSALPSKYSAAFAVGAGINASLALFNLLPFGPLDGKKVFDWDGGWWAAAMAASAALVQLT
jgi:Zn-dependent protease